MGINFLLDSLRKRFEPEVAASLVKVLRQDLLVWKAVNDDAVCRGILEVGADRINAWTPAIISLVAMGEVNLVEVLLAEPMEALKPAVRQQAVRIYEETRRRGTEPSTMQEAGLLGLALRERRRLTGSWNGLADELVMAPSGTRGINPVTWKSALACLAGFVLDPVELLQGLGSPTAMKYVLDWLVHIFITQPDVNQLVPHAVRTYLRNAPVQSQVDFLRSLVQRGFADRSQQISGYLLEESPILLKSQQKATTKSYRPIDLAEKLVLYHQMAELHKLAGNPVQARNALADAADVLRYWQVGLSYQAAGISALEKGDEREIVDLEAVNLDPEVDASFAGQAGYLASAADKIDVRMKFAQYESNDPIVKIIQAEEAFDRGDTALAREVTQAAVRRLCDWLVEMRGDIHDGFVGGWQPVSILKILEKEGLYRAGSELADAVLANKPADLELTILGSRLHKLTGNLDRARELAETALGLEADYAKSLPELASLCEQMGDWPSAYAYRKQIIDLARAYYPSEHLAYARAALNAGEIADASQTCERLLEENQESGEAHGLLGLIRMKQGRLSEAEMHLSRATLISPDQPEWWLGLSKLFLETGQPNSARDSLRAAVLAVPESAEVHSALGDLYLANNLNAEALPHLKIAASLQPDNEQVAFKLSKVFRALGYLHEARDAIEPLRAKWMADPAVAYEYGCIAHQLGDAKSAIPALEVASHAENPLPQWLLAYAKLLLEEKTLIQGFDQAHRNQLAEQQLRMILSVQPDHLEAKLHLAEALRNAGRFDEAYTLYQDLAEDKQVSLNDALWCVQHGLGMTSIGLGHIEPGIAFLREAAQNKPGSTLVLHDLTRACLDAQLNKDAEEAAEKALENAPDDLDNLDWFAGVMVQLGKPNRAADALRFAIDMSPDRVDLRIRFAQLKLENGDLQDAQEALKNLPYQDNDNPESLRQAAYLHLRMQDFASAVSNLERAVMLTDQPSADLLFDLAQVYSQTGQIDEAIKSVQQASDLCQDGKLYLFQADLLARQNQRQQAIAALEKGVKIILSSNECDCGLLPGMYHRLANWQRELGNVTSAYENAEKALLYAPDDLSSRRLACDLAVAMLQDDKARTFALQPFEAAGLEMDEHELHFACLSAHLALDHQQVDEATGLFDTCRQKNASDRWVRTLEARLLSWQGQPARAAEVVRDVLKGAVEQEIVCDEDTLWLAIAAKEAFLWRESYALLQQHLKNLSGEYRGVYEMVRWLVEAGEWDHLCKEVRIKTHAPQIDSLVSDFMERFEELMGSIEPLLKPENVARWVNRAKLVSTPTPDAIEGMSTIDLSVDDTAAMMGGLRKLNDPSSAIQLAERNNYGGLVQVQTALCHAQTNSPEAVNIAVKLVDAFPDNPVYLALYARLAEQFEQNSSGYEALARALQIWPEEEAWQAWAGDLTLALGDVKQSVTHWKEALALQPESTEYAAQLGRALYLNGDYPLAEELIQKAVERKPIDVAGWLMLAEVQRSQEKLDRALVSAVRASEADDQDVEGLMLASQISHEMGVVDEAIRYAQAAIQRRPDEIRTVINMSRLLEASGGVAESLAVIEQAIEAHGVNKDLLFEKTKLHYKLEGPVATLDEINRLIGEYPEDADILALHATIQAEIGDLKTAERSAFRSLRLEPNQPHLALTLGRMTRKSGQLDQAVHLLSQAATMDPNNVNAYLELGQTYVDRREYQKALEIFGHAIKIAPRDPRGYYQAALILKDTKDYQAAEKMLEQAARFAPEDLHIHRQLVGVMALNLIHKSQEANTAL